jgi:hypothetical protein
MNNPSLYRSRLENIHYFTLLYFTLFSVILGISLLKGTVSRDFEVCFLVPLDSSDIATPSGAVFFFKVVYVLNF